MTSFGTRIRPFVNTELSSSETLERSGDFHGSFRHLERAHVLGQSSTVQHLRVHGRMFAWGWRRRDVRECLGQLLRMVGAATKTVFGLVPEGNTGGSNVSPFRRLPLDPELAAIIRDVRRWQD
jgi:hypothetical protein